MTSDDDQDSRSAELGAFDRELCAQMSVEQMDLYHAKVVGAAIWHMAATPELAETLRDVMKRSAIEVSR